MNRKNGRPPCVPKREPFGYWDNLVYCTEMGALCEGCPYPKHGFICWFDDGTCLKAKEKAINERRRNPCQ